MRKSFLWASLAAVLTLAACQKEVQTETTEPEYDGPVAVELGVNPPSLTKAVATRSHGTVGGVEGSTNNWNGEDLYIYSFVKGTTDFTDAEAIFINNVKADAPTGADTGSLEILQTTNNEDGDNELSEPFYYFGETKYDFYGYYVDDATIPEGANEPAVPTLADGGISVPFVIDGGQDLMIAKTNINNDIVASGSAVNPDRVYSAYSARRGVRPNLVFEHVLTRFTFELVPGYSSVNDITITDLAVWSKAEGELNIVGDEALTIAEDTEAVALHLKDAGDASGDALVDLAPITLTYDEDADAQTPVPVGTSLMVIPGETSYDLQLTMQFTDDSNQEIPVLDVDIDINNVKLDGVAVDPSKGFEAGKSYKITLVVYGPEQVEVLATLEEWKKGGDQEIDPDEDDYVGLTVVEEALEFAATASSEEVGIIATHDYTVASSAEWLTVAAKADYPSAEKPHVLGKAGSGMLVLSATANSGAERTAIVTLTMKVDESTIYTKTITVTQAEVADYVEPVLALSTEAVGVDVLGGTIADAVTLTANAAWTAAVTSENSEWLTLNTASGAAGDAIAISFTATSNNVENEVAPARSAVITFTMGEETATLTVNQAADEVDENAGGEDPEGQL